MAVFMPVMQWHSEPTGGQFGGEGEEVNNERSPWNIAQTYGIPGYLEEIRFWHYLRWQLLPYLYSTALDCRDNREPMIRPLVYDYGHDPQSLACTDEYCLGKSLLVAPLMHEGEKTRTVYFPDGKWYGLFSGISYVGRREEISAKEEKFPVYLKEGTGIAMHLGTNRLLGSDIDNQVFGITSLHFILAGWEGRYAFRDEIGSITISWHGNEVTVSCNDRIEGTNTMFLSDEARAEISLGTIKYYISWEQMR
jgi:alpha-D-xyloside xylohydrolase